MALESKPKGTNLENKQENCLNSRLWDVVGVTAVSLRGEELRGMGVVASGGKGRGLVPIFENLQVHAGI